jgi:uncharacterized protein (DUF427 family)
LGATACCISRTHRPHHTRTRQRRRGVRVSLADTVLAESTRTRVIFETGLPPWYFPAEDVRVALIESQLHSVCAYKGHAEHWSVRVGGELHENVAWTYRQPRHDAAAVAGYVAFFNEQVDIVVDGQPQQRPPSPWSAPGWWNSMAAFAAQM